MAIDYVSAGASLLSAAGGLFGGGSKSAERAAKDAAAAAQRRQDDLRREARTNLAPYQLEGSESSKLLARLMGVGDPEGYTPRPTRQQFEDKYSEYHFGKYGKDYDRNSDMGTVNRVVDTWYNDAMKEWEAGKKQYLAANPSSGGNGELLRPFSQEDLNNDVVYQNGLQFGLDEGRNALEARLRASGSMGSGRALKDLTRFGNDYATTKADDAYVRGASDRDRTYNYLSNSANRGLSATGTGLGVSANAANNSSNVGINTANTVAALSANRDATRQNSLDSLLTNLLYTYKNSNPRQYQTSGATPPYFPNYYQ